MGKVDKIQRLIDQGATPGERAAAREAMRRVKAVQPPAASSIPVVTVFVNGAGISHLFVEVFHEQR